MPTPTTDDTPPFMASSSEGMSYYVSPQEIFNAVCEHLAEPASVEEEQSCGSLDDDGNGANNFDDGYRIKVLELVYPGAVGADGSSDLEAITEKWLYILENGTLVVEARADGYGNWAPNNETELGDGQNGYIEVEPDTTYTLFLSPIQLSYEMQQELCSSSQLALAGVEITTNRNDLVVAIRDPLRWAAMANRQFYQPRLRAWKSWEHNAQRGKKKFIAETLKLWLDAGDPFGIGNNMQRGQPQKWLDEYADGTSSEPGHNDYSKHAEEAAAYVAQVVDSMGYYVIERSGWSNGGADLEHVLFGLGLAIRGLKHTEPGRRLNHRLATCDTRLPAGYLFSNPNDPSPLGFGEYRYGWLGATAIVAALMEHRVEYLASLKTPPPEVEEIVIHYLKKVHVPGTWSTYRNAYRYHVEGRALTAMTSKQQDRFVETLRRVKAEALGEPYPPIDTTQFHPNFKLFADAFGTALNAINLVVEVSNLAIALNAVSSSDGGEKFDAVLGAIGASADFGVVIAEIVSSLADDSLEVGLKRMGGALTVVSGVMDAYAFGKSTASAVGEYDYGKAVGLGLATVGAAGVAASGVLAIIGAGAAAGSTAAAAGSWAGPVGAAGGFVIGVGSFLAVWLDNPPHEEFGMHCFLGESNHRQPVQYAWSPKRIPCRTIRAEVEVLRSLISNFVLQLSEDQPWLVIVPGALGAYSEFEVKVSWDNGGGSVGTAHLMLQPYRDSAEILECSNMQPSLSYTRGDNGQLEKIELNIDPNTSRGGWGIDCKVRLLADSEGPPRYTPHNGKWVHIGTRSYQQYVSSAFKKDETAQSLSEGCWVDG